MRTVLCLVVLMSMAFAAADVALAVHGCVCGCRGREDKTACAVSSCICNPPSGSRACPWKARCSLCDGTLACGQLLGHGSPHQWLDHPPCPRKSASHKQSPDAYSEMIGAFGGLQQESAPIAAYGPGYGGAQGTAAGARVRRLLDQRAQRRPQRRDGGGRAVSPPPTPASSPCPAPPR